MCDAHRVGHWLGKHKDDMFWRQLEIHTLFILDYGYNDFQYASMQDDFIISDCRFEMSIVKLYLLYLIENKFIISFDSFMFIFDLKLLFGKSPFD